MVILLRFQDGFWGDANDVGAERDEAEPQLRDEHEGGLGIHLGAAISL